MKRTEANDPFAMLQMGFCRCAEGDFDGAFRLLNKAAELGDVGAHYHLSWFFYEGHCGVEKDDKKVLHHLEQAAIGGHPNARYNLAVIEEKNGRIDRAIKHWIIAANLGHDLSLDALKDGFQRGFVSKEEFAAALSAYQAAVEATKSPQREAAETFRMLESMHISK